MSVQGTSALCTQTKIVENTTLMGTQTCAPNHCQGGNETLATQATFQSTYILAVRRNRRQETFSMPKYSLK